MTERPPTRHRFPRIASLLIVAGLIVACADEPGPVDDRQFANDPVTAAIDGATPTDAPPPASTPTLPPVASPETLLNVEGAPAVLYVLANGAIDIIDTGDPNQRKSIVVEASQVIDVVSSPGGDEVAALIVTTTESRSFGLVVFDAEGQEVQRWTELERQASLAATPQSDPAAATVGFVTWAADGDRLLASTNGTNLIAIDIGDSAEHLVVPERIQIVEHAVWSPTGNQIALLARDDDGSGAIWVMDPFVDGLSSRQVTPPDADAFNLGSVTEFAWLPDGSGFAYILATEPGIANPGGQLYTYDLATSQRVLVATPGRGGPSAQIVDLVISPDGQSVAYAISIPSGDDWRFHSLWVRSLTTSNVYQLPAFQSDHVNGMWWSEFGLVWQQQSGDERVIVLKAEGMDLQLLREHDDQASATPIASPAIATPVAATPISTPDAATPVSGTPLAGTPGSTPQAPGTPRG